MTTAVAYSPFDRRVHANPYPYYTRLRAEAPLHHVDDGDLWVLSRYDDVVSASRDWHTFSYSRSVDLDESGLRLGPGNFLACDPPTHTLLRNVVRQAFTPKAVRQTLEEAVYAEVDGALDALAKDGGGDLADTLSWNLPIWTASALLGFPREDCEVLRRVADRVLWQRIDQPFSRDEAMAGIDEILAYFDRMVRLRRQAPQDDLLTVIAHARLDGAPIGDAAKGLAGVLFLGAVDTTALLVSTGLWLLHEHEDQRAQLTQDPARIPAAVEEVLRYESPVQFFKRTTTRDVAIHDVVVPQGATVLLLYGSANRDESHFEDADSFQVARQPRRHLAFGDGIHHCLGAPVARLEANAALTRTLLRFPNYEVCGAPTWLERPNARGIAALPVALH